MYMSDRLEDALLSIISVLACAGVGVVAYLVFDVIRMALN